MKFLSILFTIAWLSFFRLGFSTNYYVHPTQGDDTYSGTSQEEAFQTLKRVSELKLQPGDQIILPSGMTFHGSMNLRDQHGSAEKPIRITTIKWNSKEEFIPAIINFKSQANGILLDGSSYIEVSQIRLTGDGMDKDAIPDYKRRCGVLITNNVDQPTHHITLRNLSVFDVFFENPGFQRGKNEVRTANGTQRYGWGIYVINNSKNTPIDFLHIEDCSVKNVSHTGIKFTGKSQQIRDVYIGKNTVNQTGGPGIQMSKVSDIHVIENTVSYSGSHDDSRKWGRGSGLWTWGSSRVLIEKNSFTYANGPGDSAGAHIDFNCDHIILQYNISAYNAGGFCEVLGNTYQCAYRYNISINDGYRIKGKNGAFQEGKTLWLSGYQGQKKKRKGPVNFYFYNNTIYCDDTLTAKIAIDNTSKGILIANNIFCLKGGAKVVLGDQYRPDTQTSQLAHNVIFQRNLFFDKNSWPAELGLKDSDPTFGDPKFKRPGGDQIKDYILIDKEIARIKGLQPRLIPGDTLGLNYPLIPDEDIMGNRVNRKPSMGALGGG